MNGPVQVVIATTEGPSTVLRVTAEDPALRSVVCLGRSTTVLPISHAYDAFVRSPTGIVERAVGHPTFRVDVSAAIDEGASWQLGLYMAHRLKAADRLAEDGQPAELVLWCTGAVDGDLRVQAVEGMAAKQRRSAALFDEAGHRVLAVVPVEQAETLADLPETVQSLAIGTVAPLLRHLRLEPPLTPYTIRRRSRWPLGGTTVAAVLAGAIALWPRPDRTPEPEHVATAPLAAAMASGAGPRPGSAVPTFDPAGVRLSLLEVRPAGGGDCGTGDHPEPVEVGRETPPGVCAVAARARNEGRIPGFVWLVALAEGTFREYAGGRRAVETAVGRLRPGEVAEIRVAAPPWVRRPVVYRVLMVLAPEEHEQVTRALGPADTLSSEDLDRLAGQFIELGLDVRTLRHRVRPRS